MPSSLTNDVDNRRASSAGSARAPLDSNQIFAALGRRALLITSSGLLIGAATFFTLMSLPKRFTSTAEIMVSPLRAETVLGASASEAAPALADEAFYQSQIAVLKSDDAVAKVTEDLNLFADPEWRGGTALVGLSPQKSDKNTNQSDQNAKAVERAEVIERVSQAINVVHNGQTYILEVSATTRDAERSEQIVTALVKNYQDKMLRNQFATATASSASIEPANLSVLKAQMEKAQNALAQAQALTNSRAKAAAPASSTPPASLNKAIVESRPDTAKATQARATLANLESKKAQLQNLVRTGSETAVIATFLNSDPLRSLAKDQQEVRNREAAAKANGEPPASIEKIRLEGVWFQSKIDAEINGALDSINGDISVAKARLNAIKASDVNLKASSAPVPSATQTAPSQQVPAPMPQVANLDTLKIEAEIAQELYNRALQPSAKTIVDAPAGTVQITEVSAASSPVKPSWPSAQLALTAASILGLLFGIGTGLTVDRLDDKMKRGADVPRMVRRNAVATLPLLSAADFRQLPPQDRHPAGYVIDKPMSTFAEGLRIVRASLIYTIRDKQSRVVTITSARHLDGKTAMSLGLARVAAMAGQKVLIVDCDRRSRAVCDLLGIEPASASTGADWRAEIIQDTETSLSILPTGDRLFEASSAFSNEPSAFVQELLNAYDLIVFDAPPVLADGDARLLAKQSDQTLVIARASQTSSAMVRKAIRQLEEDGSEVPGVVLNFVNRNVRGGLEQGQTVYHTA